MKAAQKTGLLGTPVNSPDLTGSSLRCSLVFKLIGEDTKITPQSTKVDLNNACPPGTF
jgi:hypothetical protein